MLPSSSRRYYRRRARTGSSAIAVLLYLLCLLALVAADQLTKLWAVTTLSKVGSMPVIGDIVRFTYAENTGAALSFFEGRRFVLLLIPALFSAAALVVLILRKIDSVVGNLALTLIAAGGIGNLIDRARQGFVVDFIDFHVIHFAIFNVADSCVTIGVVLLMLYVFQQESGSKRRKPKVGIFTRRRRF